MLTVGLIILLFPVYLVKAQPDFQSSRSLLFVEEGHDVNITCIYQNSIAVHLSWYKHSLGQKPKLISNFYKYEQKATFHHEFKDDARFSIVNEESITKLVIKELQLSDSATYYCGSAHTNVVEFEEGTELIVQASQLRRLSVLQQPVMKQAHYGDSVVLHCTVITDRCADDHSVYWFRHNSRESHPGVIYTHGDSNGWCKKKTTDSPTQMCIYSLPKTNLSLSDAGTYYCAVAACGEILFGNGTQLHMDITDLGCSEQVHILVLVSILRTCVLFCCVIIAVLYFCRFSKTTSSFRKTTEKRNIFLN